MADKTKKGDFVEIEFTGMVKDGNSIFDTTDAALAKKEGFHDPKQQYGPKIVCLGQGQLIKGLDEFAIEKDIGKDYEVAISPEDGFGKKSAKLLKLVPTNIFTKDNIRPMPGLPVNIDGMYGVIRTVTGGRVIVDFNHPLASKELVYKFKITKVITDDKEKLSSFLSMEMGIKNEDVSFDSQTKTAKVKVKKKIRSEERRVGKECDR
jgi:peptidylprolyl isomerase